MRGWHSANLYSKETLKLIYNDDETESDHPSSPGASQVKFQVAIGTDFPIKAELSGKGKGAIPTLIVGCFMILCIIGAAYFLF